MNELRRCSPEIERELHDKEARIRELEREARLSRRLFVEAEDRGNKLEAALERLIDAAHPHMAAQDHAPDSRCGLTQPITVAEGEELNNAVANARTTITRLHAPPDSEPAEGRGATYPKGIIEQAREQRAAEGEGGETCPVCEKGTLTRIECCICDNCDADPVLPDQIRRNDARLLSRIGSKPVQRQDAMLERRDAQAHKDAVQGDDEAEQAVQWFVDHCDSPHDDERDHYARTLRTHLRIRQSVSRTSDEGTGSVVPEVVRQLPDRWRYVSNHSPNIDLNLAAEDLDRAIAEQGGQRAPEAIRRLPEALRAEASGSFRSDAERIRDAVKREIANRLDRAIAEQGGQRVPEAPTDNGIPKLDSLCEQYNNGDLDLCALVCRVWNRAIAQSEQGSER